MLGRELAAQLRQKDIAVVSIGRGEHHEVVLDLAAPLNHYSCQGITADIVFHCAATFEGDSLAKARTNFITNAAGCCNVLQLMKQLECNACIFAGTVSSIEHFDFSPMSSYSISKSQGEKILEWGMAQTKGYFAVCASPNYTTLKVFAARISRGLGALLRTPREASTYAFRHHAACVISCISLTQRG